MGHVVSQYGMAKVAAVKEWQSPSCTQKVKSFLSFGGYYQSFCWIFVTVARLPNVLSSTETKFHWGAKERAPSSN